MLDFLKPGCSQRCDVTCQNLGGKEAAEVAQIYYLELCFGSCIFYKTSSILIAGSLYSFSIFPHHQLCSAFSSLLPGCRSLKTNTFHFSIESNLSVHDTHPIPGCLSLPGDVYATIEEDIEELSPVVANYIATDRKRTEIPPVICANPAVFNCSIACKSQYLQQFAR